MKFKSEPRKKHSEVEKDILEYWKKNNTFEKSIEQRSEDNTFRFDDGPPFITGLPHHGHLLISTVKDAVARYWTMQGKRVERAWGWDCHGLPAEVKTEEKLGIKNRSEIGTKISVKDYVQECRTAMVQGSQAWNTTVDRIGRWVDMSKPYYTMDKDYMESVWWAFNELYSGGKIYEGEKVLVYCTRDATPISKSEVAMENSYKETTDPSLFVYFKLADQSKFKDTYLLAWTTTPWTLPANVALAVNPDLSYVEVQYEDKKLIVAKGLVNKVFTNEKHQPLEFKVLGEFDVNSLLGERYEPLVENHGPQAHRIVAANFVTAEDGSGIVHIAPAYGEDDFELAKQENLPVVHMVDEVGNYASGRWQGENIWDINKEIAKTLISEGSALKVEYITHEYPHCHRCGGKLMYRAHSSWFMDIQAQKDDMIAANDTINWVPESLKDKRFKNILLSAPDWNLSRDRFWATPIPVWKGVKKDGVEVIKSFGNYKEFEEFTGLSLEDYHLPMVMDVEFELEGVTMKHIGKVLDCWFESGSVPFAQYHYPFENKEKFDSTFPADFISEAIDQTRGWFYSLMAVNVGLFGKAPFKNVISTGWIMAADGKKLSKKLKNYTEPTELMDKTSADAERLFFLTSPLVNGEDADLKDKDVEVTERKLNMLYNTYDFFTMYATVDNYEAEYGRVPNSDNPLDRWIVSRLYQVVDVTTQGMNDYKLNDASRPIVQFLDDLSNWFVRRSRKRFWKTENDSDKQNAYDTLYYVMVEMTKVMAPFTPFMAEDLFIKLTGRESVHLENWPQIGEINKIELERMAFVREVINEGLSQRAAAGMKVRQPLSDLWVKNAPDVFDVKDDKTRLSYESILREELNVKAVWYKHGKGRLDVALEMTLTPELKREGLMREVIRAVQNARKKAGLNVDDRIVLSLKTQNSTLQQAITEYAESIKGETLANVISDSKTFGYQVEQKIDGIELTLSLEKTQ